MATRIAADDIIGKYLINLGLLDAAGGVKRQIVAKTADYTIDSALHPSGTVFTNRGASGAVVFTLPAPAVSLAGVSYRFMAVAGQNITVATATADTLIAANDLTADSIAISTANQKIASVIEAICDGTAWVAYGISVGVGGDLNTTTFTIAT